MKATTLWFIVLCLVTVSQGQTSCQQQCDNTYYVCSSDAYQQLNDCLAANLPCGKKACEQGCPSGTVSLCDPKYPQGQNQCYSDYDIAIAICDANYSDCSNNCGDMILPPTARGESPKRQHKAVSKVDWARWMRNLSRPEKLRLRL